MTMLFFLKPHYETQGAIEYGALPKRLKKRYRKIITTTKRTFVDPAKLAAKKLHDMIITLLGLDVI